MRIAPPIVVDFVPVIGLQLGQDLEQNSRSVIECGLMASSERYCRLRRCLIVCLVADAYMCFVDDIFVEGQLLGCKCGEFRRRRADCVDH